VLLRLSIEIITFTGPVCANLYSLALILEDALSCNAEKVIIDPDSDPDQSKNLTNCSLSQGLPLTKVS